MMFDFKMLRIMLGKKKNSVAELYPKHHLKNIKLKAFEVMCTEGKAENVRNGSTIYLSHQHKRG